MSDATTSETSAATAADYRWLKERFSGLAEAYCLSLVRDRTPDELLSHIGATPYIHVKGVEELLEPAYDAWDEHDGEQLFVAVARLGDWTLMVEPNGYLGAFGEVLGPLSRGTTAVSHFRNVNALDHFHWYEDGELRLHFEPLFAFERDGSTPDALTDVMRDVGFDLSDGDERDYSLHTEAVFALAERLTGVRLTAELLATVEFTGALAPDPDA
ncbi:DUF6461 domain-containing protein [Streptomyces monticola]|uniref:DUF6461 domain-containing protein n=1 Tax=Streptomyces monticola TaxID=2666263 RepID=A0ABW2JQN4_9ACTN